MPLSQAMTEAVVTAAAAASSEMPASTRFFPIAM